MRLSLTFALLAVAALTSAIGGAPARAQTRVTDLASVKDRQIVVELAPGATARSASAALSSAGVRTVSAIPDHLASLRVVRVPDGQSYDAALAALQADPSVKAAGPNVIKHVSGTLRRVSDFVPDDPRFLNGAATPAQALTLPFARDSQWGLLKIGAQAAWQTTAGAKTVIVADIDTGVNFNQEDLQGRFWTNPGETASNGVDDDHNGFVDDARGFDFYTWSGGSGGDPDATDDSGETLSHGNATASIIASKGNDGIGIAGVAGGKAADDGIRLMVLRVGTDSDIPVAAEIGAIDYAIQMGADVISMSFGGVSGGQPEQDAIDRAWTAGLVICAAGGNSGQGNPAGIDLPAGFPHCICVGATTIFDTQNISGSSSLVPETRAGYSKTGPEMDICAPGTHIISAMNSVTGYTTYLGEEFTGTSAATPIASGCVGLVLSAHPEWLKSSAGGTAGAKDNNQAVRDLLESTAHQLSGADGTVNNDYGHGRVDLAKAIPAPVVAKAGDTNGDGAVDELDLQPIKAHFGAKTGDAGFQAIIDCNGDGTIDELDVFVVGRKFGS